MICRETFEQQKMDIRALQRELHANKRALEPKVTTRVLAVISRSQSSQRCMLRNFTGEDAV